MQMPGRKTILTMMVTTGTSRNRHPFPSKWCDDEFETRDSLRVFSFWLCKVVTVIVRTVSRSDIGMKIIRPSPPPPPSYQNGAMTNLRLGTVCRVLVFDYTGAEVVKYECSMWKILAGLEKFTKISESLITFVKTGKNCDISFWFYTPRGLARSDSTRRIRPHTVRQHLIRLYQCVNLHFILCVTSDRMRSWDRARLRPCGRLRQCAQTLIAKLQCWHHSFITCRN